MHIRVAACSLALIAGAQSAVADVDLVTIGVSLDFPGAAGPQGETAFRRLTGQSVFFNIRTGSSTTGGQLDGVTSFDSANEVHEISFGEVFPVVELTDYLRFGYFGVLETVEPNGDGGEVVTDRSFVIATAFDFAQGLRVEDLFPMLTEATLVNALTGSFDSSEFFATLNAAMGNNNLSGDIGLSLAGVGPIRQGSSLTLYSFFPDTTNPGSDDVGRDIGFIDTGIVRVPAPSAACALALVGLIAGRRRRA